MDIELATKRDELLAMLAEGEAYLREGGSLDTLTLGQLRWRFARAVGAYQRLKHARLFAPMMANGNPEQRARGHQLSAECLERGQGLRAFFRTWDAAAIAADPDGYRAAGLTTAGWTRICIADEFAVLETLGPVTLAA